VIPFRGRGPGRPVSVLAAACLRTRARAGGDVGASVARRLVDRVPPSWDSRALVRVRREGLLYQLDLRDYVQRHVYYTGSYERGVRDFLIAEARPDDRCVDVGANVGAYALPLARRLKHLGGGHVYAFEPALAPQAALRTSIEVAALTTITLVPLALGSRPGRGALKRLEPFPDGEVSSASLFGEGVDWARST
jgi:hypothetical protein